jgi:phytoene synthase
MIHPPPRSEHQSSFAYSFLFLPEDQREALAAVYGFCRASDDIVDGVGDSDLKAGRLRAWRGEVERAISSTEPGDPADPCTGPVATRLARAVRSYRIPVVHVHELLRGVEMDLERNRYETFEELREYCYHVASAVGLMSLSIFGASSDGARAYAVDLGIALQLTNIIRDVGTDARMGRIYLPLEDLRRFKCTEGEILQGRPSEGFRALMQAQAERANVYFARAGATLPRADRRRMLAAVIMERSYRYTLARIERSGFDVFHEPMHASRPALAVIAAGTWLQYRLLGL